MEMNTYREERRYSVPHGPLPPASEDLHAWSIYRQNLNSDFTDSALGSSDKSPLPYGNFKLRDTTVHSILNHPRYGPKSPLGSNMYTYLKFGLPRVFPPNGSQRSQRNAPHQRSRGRINRGFNRDSGGVSSGYDSSDNETTRGRLPPNLRKYRSESDFRTINMMQHSRPGSRAQNNIPVTALKQPNSRASIAGTQINQYNGTSRYSHNRSHSEADLLGGEREMVYEYDSRVYGETRDPRMRMDQYSAISRRHSSTLIYPNIQIHCLDVDEIRGVSLQAKAGDLFAIMATSSREGTALIETIAGLKERLGGEILINGQQVSRGMLRQLCGYVPALEAASLDPRMSVQNTLSYHAVLKGPLDNSDIKERIDILVEDLGLTAVRSSAISRLTHSEKQRLNVACQLLTQCSVLVLDQTTNNMDIFDTFFLVEYLRQWCSSRICIMTLQPPTFEILSMCSGVLLLSGGRTIFSGNRGDLPRHMSQLGYPCPPFKNPADYYLDLVTLDDLSAAALLESSARIESLANAWDRMNSEPPLAAPLASLPDPARSAGFFGQLITLVNRYLFYKQPGSLLTWISRLILAAVLSLCIGGIFWDIPSSDPLLVYNDRLGYHHTMMAIAFWPIILLFIRDVQNDRKSAEKDIYLQMYGRTVYIIIQSFLSVLPNICIWLAYLLPAHSMAGLYTSNNDIGIYIYLGYMVLYLMVVQTIALFSSHFLMPHKVFASLLTAVVLLVINLSVGGYIVHPANIPDFVKWLEYASPQKWVTPIFTKDEYSDEAIANSGAMQLCRNKHVQKQEIIVQQPCKINGTEILTDFKLQPYQHVLDGSDIYHSTLIGLIATCVGFFLLTAILFMANTSRIFKSKSRRR
ncbi:unnamed protein product [Chironomus riparius]|uniref:ABC transporter domain-containing protein n=1 Tax=Chironomus riparius TaxID=315576 RepID=A0A9N9RZ21_9DIPT|nr:unnamed protein product [Chironomus riparius]